VVVAEIETDCPQCGEHQSTNNDRCARCGITLETKERRKERLSEVEQARRAAERDSVAIQRLPGFGTNGVEGVPFGSKQYFATMSNQRKRRFAIVLIVMVIGLAFFWGHNGQ
jgi:hypothetical protein